MGPASTFSATSHCRFPQTPRGASLTIVAAVVILALESFGCSNRGQDPLSGGEDAGVAPRVVVGRVENIFPSRTVVDWVSYAARVSEVVVLSEAEIPPAATVLERGEGYVGRRVVLRIGETFWASSGALPPGASPTPTEVDVVVAGWVLMKGERFLFALEDSPRFEVGGRYVLPLVTLVDRSPAGSMRVAWGPLTTTSVFEVMGDEIATIDVHFRGNDNVARSLSRLTADLLRETLTSTPADPVALRYFHLPPFERWRAVQSEGK